MKVLELAVPPPVVMLITAGFMWIVAVAFPILTFAWLHSTGGAILFATMGLLIGSSAVLKFQQAHTTVHPRQLQRTRVFVRSGPYRYSRNPMYLGIVLLLLGWAILLGNAFAFLCVGGFIMYMTRYQILPEERALRHQFGEAYECYIQSVRRWI